MRDGRVIYDLFIRLTPSLMADLIARQYLPPRTVLTVVDTPASSWRDSRTATASSARRLSPALWTAAQTNAEGIAQAPTLEGMPAVAAYTHIAPFDWAVIVGAPEEVIFAPMRAAIIRVAEVGAVVLLAGLAGGVRGQGIMRPIEQLRRLAAHEDQIDPLHCGDRTARSRHGGAGVGDRGGRTSARRARHLAESEARFRALFEKSPSGTILIDPETTQIIDCNAVAASIVGCPSRSSAPRDYRFAFRTTPERIREICRSVASGATLRYETTAHRAATGRATC